MERTTKIRFPVFSGYTVEVVVADSVLKARSKRNKVYGEYKGVFHALHSYNGLGSSCIVFPKDHTTFVDIVHECYHAVAAIMRWANVDDEECVAYHVGYLTQQVYKFVTQCSKHIE